MAETELRFTYKARDNNNKIVKGEVEAGSEVRAYQILVQRGLIPLSVKAVVTAGLNMDINIPGFERGAKTKSLAVFAKQFAALIKAGMPLLRSLHIVTEQTDDKVLKEALSKTLAEVERGVSLSDAMSEHPKAFPNLMVNMVRVGEEGGFLDRTMDSVAKAYKSELELKNKVKSALTYPVIVGIVSIIMVIGMLIFIVPVFQKMFEDMGAELPLPTQILVTLSQNMIWVTPLLALLIGGTIFFVKKVKNEKWFRSRVEPLKIKAPVFGSLFLKVSIARFARQLAMMLSGGVPLMSALNLVSAAASNWSIEQALEASSTALARGRSFGETLVKEKVFPPIVSQMIMVGEESGNLPEMLNSIGDFYEDEVKESSEALASAMEPLMIVVIGVLIGGMIVALYMPMFSMFGELSNG